MRRVHTAAYWRKVRDQTLTPAEVRRLGLPQSPRLTLRSLSSCAGTLQAALHARRDGVGLNLAGGTHHAFADRGEGFCVLNDQAIAAAHLLAGDLARQVLIVDLDVHQGDGTASIFPSSRRRRLPTCCIAPHSPHTPRMPHSWASAVHSSSRRHGRLSIVCGAAMSGAEHSPVVHLHVHALRSVASARCL